MSDPAPPCARRGMAVRVPPRGHRVLTYPPATTAGAPGQHRLRAMANATVALPAGQHRLRQEGLPHNPANPRTPTYPHTHQHTAPNHTLYRRPTRDTLSRESKNPPLSTMWRGAGGEAISSPTTHQVHPAIQVPPHPRPCSTADTGFHRSHPSRAPPRPPAENLPRSAHSPLRMLERGPGMWLNIPPPRTAGGAIGGPATTLCSLCALWPKGLSAVRSAHPPPHLASSNGCSPS